MKLLITLAVIVIMQIVAFPFRKFAPA